MALSKDITFQNSGYFTKIMIDYLNANDNLKPFYNHYPTLENFKLQIEQKKNFSQSHRTVLTTALTEQYNGFALSEETQNNIELLNQNTTFTITTGHQLNLFTGPLYFLYKIVSTINLTKELKTQYPSYDFVPIYWMATEDHDFEEINHFQLNQRKITWNKEASGAVGELDLEGLDEVFTAFSAEIGISKDATYLRTLFKKAYLEHKNLTDATLYLANELFATHGLVVVDANKKSLKKLFTPYIKEELLQQTSYKQVAKTIQGFDYPIQVNPREINLFYLDKNLRERIIKEDTSYRVNTTDLVFSETEILDLVDSNPEKFSPNVILRPLYQEVILPNLCYIGGGGELAYWLELKSFFEAVDIPFPMLLLRNSVLLLTQKQARKMDKLGLSFSEIFQKQEILVDQKTEAFSETSVDFQELKNQLENQFKLLRAQVLKTDKSFEGAVNAQERKQIKGLENLEKRLRKANKKYFAERLDQIIALQDQLFPNQSLQERQGNFSEFYAQYGKELIDKLFEQLKPLDHNFDIIVL